MVKKIAIESEDNQKGREKVVEEMGLEDPQDRSVKQFFDDILDGKLAETWKDLENTVSEMFNSRIMAKIYLYLVRSPGKTVEEVTGRMEYSREQVVEHLSKLLRRGYIKETLEGASELEERLGTYVASPPGEVARKVARTVEKKIIALANIDPILLKKAKKISLLPIKIIVGEGDDEKNEED